MDKFEYATLVEHQEVQLEKARAVLSEASAYFVLDLDNKMLGAITLADKAEHILNLLYVVDELILGTIPELKAIKNELHNDWKRRREARR